MPWPYVHSDAYLDRAVPGHHPDPSVPARKVDRAFPEAVLLAPPGKRGSTLEQQVPLAGSGHGAGRTERLPASSPSGVIHVGCSEDVHSSFRGCPAGTDQPDDAVDDAPDVDLLLFSAPQWACLILGRFQPDSNGNSVLYYRLGKPAPIEEDRADPSDSNRSAGQGDSAKWKLWK